MACRMLVPPPGIKPKPSAVKARSPNHWTARECFPGELLKTIATWALSVYSESIVKAFVFAGKRKKVRLVSPFFLPPAWNAHRCLGPGQPLGSHKGNLGELLRYP